MAVLAFLASIGLLALSLAIKGHSPQLSSLSFVCSLLVLFGIMMSVLVPRIQTFLDDRGFRGIGIDVNGSPGGSWSDSDWGGDCGGDGGGGDCGG